MVCHLQEVSVYTINILKFNVYLPSEKAWKFFCSSLSDWKGIVSYCHTKAYGVCLASQSAVESNLLKQNSFWEIIL